MLPSERSGPRALARPVMPPPTLWMLESSVLQLACNVYKSLLPFPGDTVNTRGLRSAGCVIVVLVHGSNNVLRPCGRPGRRRGPYPGSSRLACLLPAGPTAPWVPLLRVGAHRRAGPRGSRRRGGTRVTPGLPLSPRLQLAGPCVQMPLGSVHPSPLCTEYSTCVYTCVPLCARECACMCSWCVREHRARVCHAHVRARVLGALRVCHAMCVPAPWCVTRVCARHPAPSPPAPAADPNCRATAAGQRRRLLARPRPARGGGAPSVQTPPPGWMANVGGSPGERFPHLITPREGSGVGPGARDGENKAPLCAWAAGAAPRS